MSSSTSTTEFYDVAIIGGGLSGLISAISLKQKGFNVIIVDGAKVTRQSQGDHRTSHVSKKSMNFLSSLGLGEELIQKSQKINHIYIFEENQKPILSFDPPSNLKFKNPSETETKTEAPTPASREMGYVIFNSDFKRIILNKALSSNIPIIEELKVESVTTQHQFAYLKPLSSSQETIKTRLALSCTGKHSIKKLTFLKDLGFKEVQRAYNQSALVFNIEHTLPHRNIAIESFTPHGPLAMLPAPDIQAEQGSDSNISTECTQSSIIWCETDRNAKYLSKLPKEDLLKIISHKTQRFRHIGKITNITSPTQLWPLSFTASNKATEGRTILLGDALSSIHPVAGQAFNATMQDIEALSTHLESLKKLGIDIGSAASTLPIRQKFLQHHAKFSIATDSLVRLFSNNLQIAKLARNTGICIVDKIPPLKNLLIKIAGGA